MKEIIDCVVQLAGLFVNMFCQLLTVDLGPIGELHDTIDITIGIIGIIIIAFVAFIAFITRND